MHPNEAELDNALVQQKDRLLRLINEAVESDNPHLLYVVTDCLEFVSELWNVCDYTYKVAEIRARIRDAFTHFA